MKQIKRFIATTILVLIFLPVIIPEKEEAILKLISNIRVGPYYLAPYYAVVIIILSIYGILFFLKIKYIRLKTIVLVLLISTLMSADFLRGNDFCIIFYAYLMWLIPFISGIVVLQLLGDEAGRIIHFLARISFFFISIQTIVFAFFPRISWIRESFKFGGVTLYRTITTIGPQTASAYIVIGLFVLAYITSGKSKYYLFDNVILILATLFSFTRGAILLLIFMMMCINIKKSGLKIRNWINILLVLLIFTMVFPTMLEIRKIQGFGRAGDIYRLERIEESYKYFTTLDTTKKILGIGFGMGYPRETDYLLNYNLNFFPLKSPHNLNLVLLVELGIVRFGILYLFIFYFLHIFKLIPEVFAYFLFTLIITFNTEVIFLYIQYNFVLILILVYTLHLVYRSKKVRKV
ncbi:hypothetical protein [Caldanaerobacter subterraneus]|uniref:hypothetical protein n=1 Tax=Caldanaerobacter subterraneus TaxID=911092 RepID=UPI001478D95A|nr:hypothetical protein [Caldanaerobacter subterraneus]